MYARKQGCEWHATFDMSKNRWIQAAWRRETLKVENAVVTEARTMEAVGMRLKFEDNAIQLDGEWIKQEWKSTWKRVKTVLQKGNKQMRIETYQSKDQQGRFFRKQDEECHLWLAQNLHSRKTSSIISILEQMMETRTWKMTRGLIEDGRCRVYHGHDETMEHLVAECSVLDSEYLTRQNRALMIPAVTSAKEHKLIRADRVRNKERWGQGMILENHKVKLVWDFQFNLRKTETSLQ